MAVSKTDICNLALARVGAQSIMDIDDADSKGARACKNAYDANLREVLRARPWNCLSDRAELAELTTPPAFGFAKQFQLPTNFVRLTKLNGVEVDDDEPGDYFKIEKGKHLLTDADEAKIQYVAYSDDPNDYDALLVDCVVVLLASKIAVPMRQDEAMASNLRGEYERVTLPRAGKTDGNERKSRRYDPCSESRFINARRISTNG
jgi:hypothetical protein